MNAEKLISKDYLICIEKISEKLGERHLKAVFASLDISFKEKNDSFWQMLFAEPNVKGIPQLHIKGYVKEGVVWYDSINYERVSVNEEMALNNFFKGKPIDEFQKYELQLKMKTLFENLKKRKHKKQFVAYFK